MRLRDIKEGEIYRLRVGTPAHPEGTIIRVTTKIIYHGVVMGTVVLSSTTTDKDVSGYYAFNPWGMEELE